MLYTLPSGSRVLIRPIAADDKDKLARGLRQLSEESIRKRFLAAKPRFTRAELRYLTEVDGRQPHRARRGAGGRSRPARGGGALRPAPRPRQATAEMAIVVGDPWQNQGLGRAMATRAGRRGARRRHPPLRGDDARRQRGRPAADAHVRAPARGGPACTAACARSSSSWPRNRGSLDWFPVGCAAGRRIPGARSSPPVPPEKRLSPTTLRRPPAGARRPRRARGLPVPTSRDADAALYVNAAFEALTGWSADEALGRGLGRRARTGAGRARAARSGDRRDPRAATARRMRCELAVQRAGRRLVGGRPRRRATSAPTRP